MSIHLSLFAEFARRRAEVEADGETLWVRVDDDVVSLHPTRQMIAAMRDALDVIEANLIQEAA